MRKIANTDDAFPALGGMFVSPDGDWVAFFTMDAGGSPVGLASVSIESGLRVEHELSPSPCFDIRELSKRSGNPFATMQVIAVEGAGWAAGRLYFPDPRGAPGRRLVVCDSLREISCDVAPTESVAVSDGPAWDGLWSELRRRSDVLGREVGGDAFELEGYSVAWRDGCYDATTYCYESRKQEIVAYEDGRTPTTIVDLNRDTPYRAVHFSGLRVAPDESLLAYVLNFSNADIPTPFFEDVMYVVDLKTGKERAACSFHFIGSMYWSADSRRLFVGGQGGIYEVDISVLFPKH